MNITQEKTPAVQYTIFEGQMRRSSGPLPHILQHLKENQFTETVLIFDDQTGRQVDFDLRGSLPEVLSRYEAAQPEGSQPPAGGRGRPKLGVVSREVSLLPRHWEWLEAQGNASATLRRLIDDERRRHPAQEQKARARAAADRFMQALCGNLSGYQEASRALYAGQREAFTMQLQSWPQDVREHALRLAEGAFEDE